MNLDLLLLLFLPADAICLGVLIFRRNYQGAATYFDVSRIVVVLLLAWTVIAGVATASTVEKISALTVDLIACYLVLVLVTAMVTRRYRLVPWLGAATAILSALALISIPATYLLFPAGATSSALPVVQSALRQRQDSQTVRDFQLLSQDVENYDFKHNRLPATLHDAVSEPRSLSSSEGIDNRLSSYTYKPRSGREFQLCATFNSVVRTGTDYRGFTVAENHNQGYQCFTYDQP